MQIGFIGLGMMGTGMARNLVKAGHHVRAWNRSAHSLEGVERAATPSEAFASDVVFTMLSDDAVIREILLDSDVLTAARPGVVHVVTSTISVQFADELTAHHAKANVGYVSAPVFGRPDVAAAGELVIVAAGKTAAVEKVKPLLSVIGKKTFVMGADPKQANAAKIGGNMMIAMAIEAMAEASTITADNGLSAKDFFELVMHTHFGGRAYDVYSAKIVKRDFEAGFKLKLGLKDLRLAVSAAEKAGKKLPMLEALKTQMSAAHDSGLAEKDWSAVAGFTAGH